jgi:signal transduction histidine kinase
MTLTLERSPPEAASRSPARRLRRLGWPLASIGVAAAVVAALDGWDGGAGGRSAWVVLVATWGAAGAVLLAHDEDERLGLLALWFCVLAGMVAAAGGVARDRAGDDAVLLVQAVALAVLPAAVLHVLLGLPWGSLGSPARVVVVATGYVAAVVVGVLVWNARPSQPTWPIVLEAIAAAAVGIQGALPRYRVARGRERLRMHWVALAIAVATEVVLVALTLHLLLDWPQGFLEIAAAATLPLPLALVLSTSDRLGRSADRLLVPAVSVAGLTGIVAAVYLLVVLALGRPPTDDERTALALSVLAAAISALLYVPARARLNAYANRLAHGTREAPRDVVRTFGARLSRAVPLEELFLQLAESLRAALALEAAEIWTTGSGRLERVASEPDRGPASLSLTTAEEAVLARTRISGGARIAVWAPGLLNQRGDALVRMAPITNAEELLGLIVAERAADSEPFDAESERILAELARQVGLALRNARLDSELQASLDELRRQADELRASRARLVAAADAERRRIERDLHDGAQQYLVGLAVNLRVARDLSDSDPGRAQEILDELRDTVEAAMEQFRDLAHGIYPPLLQDRGLAEALANAARHAPIPTRVDANGLDRYEPDVEATVYFCCLEALQNAAKHAGEAARATVRVWAKEDGLLFEVTDDGAGLDPAAGAVGAGLTNMRDRLGAIGGALRLDSVPGRGTTVSGVIPLDVRRRARPGTEGPPSPGG